MQVKPSSEASADNVRVTVKEFVRKLTRRWEQLMKLGFYNSHSTDSFFLFSRLKQKNLGRVRHGHGFGKGRSVWDWRTENVNWFRKTPISPTCLTTYIVENGTFP